VLAAGASSAKSPALDLEDTDAAFVQSLERGLRVITVFDAQAPLLTLSEVAERTELSAAAARRFLHTLARLGYVHTDGKRFSLTARVMELGYSFLASQGLAEVMTPRLEALSAQLGESSAAAIIDGGDIAYIATAPGSSLMRVHIPVGTRHHVAVTALGRILLATMPENEAALVLRYQPIPSLTPSTTTSVSAVQRQLLVAHDQGYAVVDRELELGMRSLAVPIRDGLGAVVAAIGISTGTSQPVSNTVALYLPALTATAAAIEADLRAGRPQTSSGTLFSL